jgi:hypothetical protein
MLTGTIANYDITYSMDNGVTYKNLYYRRTAMTGIGGSTVITMANTDGIAVGDYIWGTGVAPNAKVVSFGALNSINVDIANTGGVSGVLRFNQLPSETVADTAVGTPLRIRVKTTTANTAAFDALSVYTYSAAADRAATYDLDTNTLTLTGLIPGSDVVINTSGTNTTVGEVDTLVGSTFVWTFSGAQTVDIKIMMSGYRPWQLYDFHVDPVDSSLPIAQEIDRAYQ